MYNNMISFLYLLICSYTDIRNKYISFQLSLSFLIFGFITNILMLNNLSLKKLTVNIMIVLFFIFIYFVSKKQLGTGDIMMISVLSFFYSFESLVEIITFSFFSAGIFSIVILALKKADKKNTIPFAPFLLLGLLIFITLSLF